MLKYILGKREKAVVCMLLFAFFVSLNVCFAASTPKFGFINSLQTLSVSDDVVTQDVMKLKNFDSSQYIYLLMSGTVNGEDVVDGWVFFEEDYVELAPGQEKNLNYAIYVPENVCNGVYDVFLKAKLAYYDNQSSSGTSLTFSTAIGVKVQVTVNSGISCNPGDPIPGIDSDISPVQKAYIYSLINKDENETIPPIIAIALNVSVSAISRLVYYDYEGNGIYSAAAASNDEIINLGNVYIHDLSDDSLLETTDLSLTGGQYNVPTGTFTGTKDIYIKTEFEKESSPGVLDTTWEGNFYVNRDGDSSDLKNAFVKYGITDYHDIYEQLDIRSRNTDRYGDFGSGTMSIGPDDLDQIISPSRWDMEVSGTDFKYADLDHSGRIGPDDKDHIISPKYWDFPN
ncbi:hypothetical protein GF354_02415 [Candidatus Peregrinibacteria bacterium]|nr:hypothetical protein [Candidatus Peregrinibacteria bacterium]